MRADSLIIEVVSYDWLSQCGQALHLESLKIERVFNWRDAEALCESRQWTYATEEAQGALTSYLSKKYPQKYQGVWNKKIREVKAEFDAAIAPKLRVAQAHHKFSDKVIEHIKWDVIHALMTDYYAACSPPDFFLKLLAIYKMGHFPCGWSGEWPIGQLQVF